MCDNVQYCVVTDLPVNLWETSGYMDRYKEKNCKFCNKTHKKRGLYCCQSCANRDREVSDKVRDNMRQVATEYNLTPEAAVKRNQLNTPLAAMTVEDFAIDIPEIKDLSDYTEFLDGFDRGEKWWLPPASNPSIITYFRSPVKPADVA